MSTLNTSNPVALRYLFDETLFILDEKREIQSEPKFWGGNQRKIAFIHYSVAQENLESQSMEAFLKILGALKLNESDVTLLNFVQFGTAEDGLSFIAKNLVYEKLIFLGSDFPEKISAIAEKNLHTPFSWKMDPASTYIETLITYSFSEMLVDDLKKRQFWTVLKTLLS